MRLTSLLVILSLCSSRHISHAFPLKPRASPKGPAVERHVAYSVVAVDGGSATATQAVQGPFTLTLIQTMDSIETVTAPISSAPPLTENISITDVINDSEPAKTMFISLTLTSSPTTIPSYIFAEATPTLSSRAPSQSQPVAGVPGGKCVTSSSALKVALSSNSIAPMPTASIYSASSNRISNATHPLEANNPEAKLPDAAGYILSPSSRQPPLSTTFSTLPTVSTKIYDDGRWHTSYPVRNASATVLTSASATAVY